MNQDILIRLLRLRDVDVEPSAHTREIAHDAIVEIERLRDIEWRMKGLEK